TFDLTSQVFSFFGTYGVTDKWDINVVVPVILTSLDVVANANIHHQGGDHQFLLVGQNSYDVVEGTTIKSIRLQFVTVRPHQVTGTISDSKFGVGDILLRTKYRLNDQAGMNMAAGLGIRLPSGTPGNFQGTGDTFAGPFLIASRNFGP